MWFGRFDRLLCRRGNDVWEQIGLFDEHDQFAALPSVNLQCVGTTLWLGLWGDGILQIEADGDMVRYVTADTITANAIGVITQNADGTMWFGTKGHGLNRLTTRGAWTTYTARDGLVSNRILAICPSRVWFASAHNQLWRLDGAGQWTEIALPTDFDGEVTALCGGADGMIWLGSRAYLGTTYGLLRLDPNQQWQRFDTDDGLASCSINALYASRDGTLWLGTDAGLCHYAPHGEHLMDEEKRASTYYQVNRSTIEITMPDGSPATSEALYTALNDEDADVRVSAAVGLAKLGDLSPTVTNTLFNAADWRCDPEAGDTARYGITALAKMNPVIIELLLAALQENKGWLSGVAECLGKIGQASPAVINGLLTFSQQSNDQYAVVSALHSLLQLGIENAAILAQLLGLYKQDDIIVRTVVLQALGLVQQPSPAALALLIAAAQRKAPNKRNAAERLRLTDPDDPQWTARFFASLEAEVGQTRRNAIKALGTTPNPPANVTEILCVALADEDWFVRREAVESLGRIGNPTLAVIEALLALLATEEAKEQARRQRTQQQSTVGEDPEDVRAMLAALQESQSLRGDVAMTLAQLGCINDAVIAAFLAELGAEDASVRERIVRNWWLLGKDNPAVLAALRAALHDEAEMVRLSAAATLQRFGESSTDELFSVDC